MTLERIVKRAYMSGAVQFIGLRVVPARIFIQAVYQQIDFQRYDVVLCFNVQSGRGLGICQRIV